MLTESIKELLGKKAVIIRFVIFYVIAMIAADQVQIPLVLTILHLYLNQLEYKHVNHTDNNHAKHPTIFTILRCGYIWMRIFFNLLTLLWGNNGRKIQSVGYESKRSQQLYLLIVDSTLVIEYLQISSYLVLYSN